MSTVERTKPQTLPPLVAGRRLDQPTFHRRYEAMPDGIWAELVGGVVYVPSPVRNEHSEYNDDVAYWYGHYKRATMGVRSGKNATIILDEIGETQPDGHLRVPQALGGQTRIERGFIVGAPELIIEIARSSSTYDLNQKKNDCERTGVREYLVVELDTNQVHWFVRRGSRFVNLRPAWDGTYRSKVFPGLWLDPDALYTEDLDRLIEVLENGLATPAHTAFVAKLAAAGAARRPR